MKFAFSLGLGLMLAASVEVGAPLRASEPWMTALAAMPLGTKVTELTRTNTVGVMLGALRPDPVVKGLIFMPGATDELYFFRRVNVHLPTRAGASELTLLDAVTALTNQTYITVTYRAPLLLLHTTEDATDGFATVQSPSARARLEARRVRDHLLFNDRDWDSLQPVLQEHEYIYVEPGLYTMDTWHFYRHSFAAWNLNEWELLEAVALAGKTRFTLTRWHATYSGDERHGPIPAQEKIKMYLD